MHLLNLLAEGNNRGEDHPAGVVHVPHLSASLILCCRKQASGQDRPLVKLHAVFLVFLNVIKMNANMAQAGSVCTCL